MIALALRTWVRYLVPLTLLTVLACAPILYLALTASAPKDVPGARLQVRLTWVLAGAALAFQLLAVAAAAPAVRSVAAGTPLSQLGALGAGLRNLARALVPWTVAIAAVLLGSVALVIPGALLACLVSLTGASDSLHAGAQTAIADSIATVRTQLPRVALVVFAILAIDLAITFAAQLHYVPVITKKLVAAKLAPLRMFVRTTGLAIVAISALPACVLAAAYSDTKRT